MQSSPYTKAVPAILAEMEQERQEDDKQQPDQKTQTEQEEVIYVYRTTEGGMLLSPTKIGEGEAKEPQAPTVDSTTPTTDHRPTTTSRREPPIVLYFLLLLVFFTVLDNADTFFTLLTPTVTVTITPQVKTISTTATVSVGEGADVSGRILAPLTLSQTQTVKASGHGHQDAQRATGTLIYFNGSFAPQTVNAGTIYAGSDGVQVVTNETVTIPAAQPGNPPQFGETIVSASAILVGANGNIQAGDIHITTNTLQVRNSQFHDGQDARDFTTVTHADIDQPAATLKAQVTQNMQAALQGQVKTGEQLLTLPCSFTTTANHGVGDEALSVTVTVSQTCSAIVYDTAQLTTQAARQLTAQAAKQLGSGYKLYGSVTIKATKTTATNKKNVVVLSFTCRGTWVYQINEFQIAARILGKPRIEALHLVEETPGVQTVSIAGVSDNQPLPSDAAHIHFSIFYRVS